MSQPTEDGSYRLDVSSLTPPFVLQATFAVGPPLYSLAAAAGTCNVNPLTDALVTAAGGRAAALLYATPAPSALAETVAALPAAVAAQAARLQPLVGGAPMDPFTAPPAPTGAGLAGLAATLSVGGAADTVVLRSPEMGVSIYLGDDASALTLLTWVGRSGGQDPRVAVDPLGGAVVVWVEPGADHWGVWAQRRSPTGGWLPAVQVSDGTSDGAGPVVALDASGGGFAAWCQWDGTDATIWAAPFAPTSGWGAPVAVEARAGYSCMPRLAVNAGGDAALAWGRQVELPTRRTDVWVSRLTAGEPWSAPEPVSDQVEWADSPELVLSGSGETTIAWDRMVGMRLTLWTASAPAGATFSAPVLLSTPGHDVYGQTSLAVDGAGRVLALWPEAQAGVGFVPWAARRDDAGVWAAGVQVGDGLSDSAYFPSVALNAAGVGVAAWKQGDGARYQVQAARFDPVAGWEPPVAIEAGSGDADYPAAAVDGAGNGMVAWTQLEAGTIFVRANRFFAGGAWLGSSDEQQATAMVPDGMGYHPLQLGMNAAGVAVVVWSEDSM